MRVTIACSWCRKAKIKCHHDGKPPCRACLRNPSRECTLSLPSSQTRLQRPARVQNGINLGLKDLEVSRSLADDESCVPRTVSHDDADAEASASLTEQGPRAFLISSPSQDPRHGGIFSEVSLAKVQEVARVFLDIFPELVCFHRPTFFSDLEQGSVDRALLLAILALCARYNPTLVSTYGGAIEASEHFAQQARAEIAPRLLTRSDPSTLQSLLVLIMHDWGTCNGFRAWMYIGIAARMGQTFAGLPGVDTKANTSNRSMAQQSSALTQTSREIICRTLWASYAIDCMLASARYGPSSYRNVPPSWRLPRPEDDFLFNDQPIEPDEYLVDLSMSPTELGRTVSHKPLTLDNYSVIIIRAMQIWSELSQWICNGGRRMVDPLFGGPPWVAGTNWNRLYTNLNHWHSRIDSRLWYEAGRNIEVFISRNQGRHFALVNILFSISQIFLHREYIPFLPHRAPCPCGPIDPPLLPKDCPSNWWINGSIELFQAACTITDVLRQLEEAALRFETPFVCFSAYIATATLVYGRTFPHMAPGLSNAQTRIDWGISWLDRASQIWPLCSGWHRNLLELVALYEKVRQNADKLPTIGRDNFIELEDTLNRFAAVEHMPSQTNVDPAAHALFSLDQSRGRSQTASGTDAQISNLPGTDTRREANSTERDSEHEMSRPTVGRANLDLTDEDCILGADDFDFNVDDFVRSQGLISSMLVGQSTSNWFQEFHNASDY